ncbi:MAG: cyclase family protein [Betaproteobacteria bacterium]|jgi:kynurenine formamidase|nr:cyclase family protein [Betaproteobacteria bacterium]
MQRWKQRPEGSNWGEFGPDDQRGRMNWVTREKVLQGVAEVKEGITFCLSLPLDYPGGSVLNPRRSPPRLAPTLRDGKSAGAQNFCWAFSNENPDHTDVISDDVVLLTLQYSTQWDSFAHYASCFDADGDGQREIVFYNGFRGGADIRPAAGEKKNAEPWAKYEGAKADALGIQNLAEHGAQGRGVMINLHAHFGRARKAVDYDALMRVLEADKVEVERGDMVCLYTGFADVILELKKNPDPKLLHNTCSGLDGRDDNLLQWITDSGLACLLADNYAVELIPTSLTKPAPHAMMPLHEHCLFKNGIHLGEMWYFRELAGWLRAHKRNRFLLTAPPLRLPGAVGSPATPIATV